MKVLRTFGGVGLAWAKLRSAVGGGEKSWRGEGGGGIVGFRTKL